MHTSRHIVAALTLAACFGSAHADMLQGSGSNLPLPTPTGIVDDRIYATVGPSGLLGDFTGSWTVPVLAPWQGTFAALGPNPSISQGTPGFTAFNFSGLNAGFLPAGTTINLGDLDGGSQSSERFVLSAFDVNGVQITTPWLSEPGFAWGIGGGPGGSILTTDMPGWSFVGGVYEFIGSTVSGNPTLSVTLDTYENIRFLDVQRDSGFAQIWFQAPVPAPGAGVVLAAGGLLAARRRR